MKQYWQRTSKPLSYQLQPPVARLPATGLQLLMGGRRRRAPAGGSYITPRSTYSIYKERRAARSLTWRLNTIQGAVTGTAHLLGTRVKNSARVVARLLLCGWSRNSPWPLPSWAIGRETGPLYSNFGGAQSPRYGAPPPVNGPQSILRWPNLAAWQPWLGLD